MEKITPLEDKFIINRDGDIYGQRPPNPQEIMNKINEIINVLNEFIKWKELKANDKNN